MFMIIQAFSFLRISSIFGVIDIVKYFYLNITSITIINSFLAIVSNIQIFFIGLAIIVVSAVYFLVSTFVIINENDYKELEVNDIITGNASDDLVKANIYNEPTYKDYISLRQDYYDELYKNHNDFQIV